MQYCNIKMNIKKVYNKSVILSKYKKLPPTPHFNKPIACEVDVYSEESVDPISFKMPMVHKDMLIFTPRTNIHRSSPKPVTKSKSSHKMVVVRDKISIFSFLISFMRLNPDAKTWYYSINDGETQGPESSRRMDELWRADKLPLKRTMIYSDDVSFLNPTTKEFTKPIRSLDQFVPIKILLDHSIFQKAKLSTNIVPCKETSSANTNTTVPEKEESKVKDKEESKITATSELKEETSFKNKTETKRGYSDSPNKQKKVSTKKTKKKQEKQAEVKSDEVKEKGEHKKDADNEFEKTEITKIKPKTDLEEKSPEDIDSESSKTKSKKSKRKRTELQPNEDKVNKKRSKVNKEEGPTLVHVEPPTIDSTDAGKKEPDKKTKSEEASVE